MVSEDENEGLCQDPRKEEVKEAVFSIPTQSSSGPDGFGSAFFISCWDIVKMDVVEAAKGFL